jgi:hypothetical protein
MAHTRDHTGDHTGMDPFAGTHAPYDIMMLSEEDMVSSLTLGPNLHDSLYPSPIVQQELHMWIA